MCVSVAGLGSEQYYPSLKKGVAKGIKHLLCDGDGGAGMDIRFQCESMHPNLQAS